MGLAHHLGHWWSSASRWSPHMLLAFSADVQWWGTKAAGGGRRHVCMAEESPSPRSIEYLKGGFDTTIHTSLFATV